MSQAASVGWAVRRRRMAWLCVLVVVTFAGVASGWWYLASAEEREYQEVLAETDRLDPGWRFADIEAARERIPDALLAIHDGDHAAIVDAVHICLNVPRSIGDQPGWLGQEVYVANMDPALRVLNRALVKSTWTKAELAAVQELLECELAKPRLLWASRGERAYQVETLEAMRNTGVDAFRSYQPGWRGWVSNRTANLFQPNRAEWLRTLNEIVAASRLPVEEQVAAAARIRDAHASDDGFRVNNGKVFHAMTKDHVCCQARLRCALLAVAAVRHRQERGAWPESLSALVQHGYLAKVPLDPQDGQPMRYRQLADGVVFYSIGPDRVDWGGISTRPDLPMGAQGADYFRLWDAAR